MDAAGVVLAVMILPIVSAIAREAFSQTPRKLQEGAQALGATRWEMIRSAVLPWSRGGITGAVMLGLGRALEPLEREAPRERQAHADDVGERGLGRPERVERLQTAEEIERLAEDYRTFGIGRSFAARR